MNFNEFYFKRNECLFSQNLTSYAMYMTSGSQRKYSSSKTKIISYWYFNFSSLQGPLTWNSNTRQAKTTNYIVLLDMLYIENTGQKKFSWQIKLTNITSPRQLLNGQRMLIISMSLLKLRSWNFVSIYGKTTEICKQIKKTEVLEKQDGRIKITISG